MRTVLSQHFVLLFFFPWPQAHSSMKAMQKDVIATRVESAELNACLVKERGKNEALRTQLKEEVGRRCGQSQGPCDIVVGKDALAA